MNLTVADEVKDKPFTRIQQVKFSIKCWFKNIIERRKRNKLKKAIAYIVDNNIHSSYVRYAKNEFDVAFKTVWKDCEKDTIGYEMQQLMCKQLIEILSLLDTQGDSGTSIGYKMNLFNKLINFKTIAPLTFTDDEFDTNTYGGDVRQNKRDSRIFKDENDRFHFLYAYSKRPTYYCGVNSEVIKLKKNYTTSGNLLVVKPDGSTYIVGTAYIKNTKKFNEQSFEIPSYEIEYPHDWWICLVKESDIEELRKHYDLEIKESNIQEEINLQDGRYAKEIQSRIDKVVAYMYPKNK